MVRKAIYRKSFQTRIFLLALPLFFNRLTPREGAASSPPLFSAYLYLGFLLFSGFIQWRVPLGSCGTSKINEDFYGRTLSGGIITIASPSSCSSSSSSNLIEKPLQRHGGRLEHNETLWILLWCRNDTLKQLVKVSETTLYRHLGVVK